MPLLQACQRAIANKSVASKPPRGKPPLSPKGRTTAKRPAASGVASASSTPGSGGVGVLAAASIVASMKRPAASSVASDADPGPRRVGVLGVSVPQHLRVRQQTRLRELFQRVNAECVKLEGSSLLPKRSLVVGTDCSGAEAPIWALRGVGVRHEHAFSCDWQRVVRDFIAATCPPAGPIFDDMLRRKTSDIPDHDVYVCGFPCTPYSLLRRHDTKLLREEAAKPFFKILEVLKTCLPAMAVLENVKGVKKVMKAVIKALQRLQWYFVIVVPIDSVDLGEPVHRPRYYFILVRRDVAKWEPSRMRQVAESLASAARRDVDEHISSLLLPASEPCVQKILSEQRPAIVRKADPRWKMRHANYQHQHGLSASGVRACQSGIRGVPAGRCVEACGLILAAHPGQDVIAEVGQNVDRAACTTTGISPTLTPAARMYVKAVNRCILPVEKLLLHGFPIHNMKIPSTVSDTTLGNLGGNTMHLMSVGLALLIGIALVNWDSSAAATGRTPAGEPGKLLDPIFLDSAHKAREVAAARPKRKATAVAARPTRKATAAQRPAMKVRRLGRRVGV